jgi:hypothetical protein
MTMRSRLQVLVRDERGGPLAEFALVIGLLFVVAIFVFEMSRFFMQAAMAEYATHLAARVAAVRPPVCPGLPDFNERASGSTARFGMMCTAKPATSVHPADRPTVRALGRCRGRWRSAARPADCHHARRGSQRGDKRMTLGPRAISLIWGSVE